MEMYICIMVDLLVCHVVELYSCVCVGGGVVELLSRVFV